MNASGGHGVVVAGEPVARGVVRRLVSPLLHLPTWSRLLIATKQRAPAGRGGDFFEVVQHRDGSVSTFMADVCGNGPAAAEPVERLRQVLRQHLARGDRPGDLLATLNDWLLRQQTDDRFVTALCVRVDPVSGRIGVAGAGHLGPFIKRANGNSEIFPLSGGIALGILPEQSYRETSATLGPEDTIVLCTDGITDQLGTVADPLGQAGLLARLARARPGAESICGALLGSDAPIAEDATVVVIQLPRRSRRRTPLARGV